MIPFRTTTDQSEVMNGQRLYLTPMAAAPGNRSQLVLLATRDNDDVQLSLTQGSSTMCCVHSGLRQIYFSTTVYRLQLFEKLYLLALPLPVPVLPSIYTRSLGKLPTVPFLFRLPTICPVGVKITTLFFLYYVVKKF